MAELSRLFAMRCAKRNELPASHSSQPVDITHHFNETTLARKPSSLKGLYKYYMMPGMSNIAGGLPHPGYFPFDSLSADVASPQRLIDTTFHGISSKPASFFSRQKPSPDSTQLRIPKFEPTHPNATRIDLATTLQYGVANGLPVLAAFVREFTFSHLLQGALPYDVEHADILLDCGSTDGLSKVIGLLGTKGDSMLVEEFCYTNAVQSATPFGISTVPVKMDTGGMRVDGPGGLRDILESWDEKIMGRRPHFMYTVSIGQNPTGATLKQQRRKQIYALCEKFDIIIVEDDPYWHLQYTASSRERPEGAKYPFLAALEPSFLKIDVSGRVIRLDTFSKTIAPGCRLGWITAQKPIIEALIAATESSTQQPSGFVQGMVAELLCRTWGMDGWVSWLESLRDVYSERMLLMSSILSAGADLITTSTDATGLEIVTKLQMYTFTPPDGGMFIWVRILIMTHPSYGAFLARGHTKAEMMERLWVYVALARKSLPCPGWVFAGNDSCRDAADEYLRFTFAAVEIGEVPSATERWVQGITEFWGLNASEIEVIEDEGEKGIAVKESGVPGKAAVAGGWGGFKGGKGRLDESFTFERCV